MIIIQYNTCTLSIRKHRESRKGLSKTYKRDSEIFTGTIGAISKEIMGGLRRNC